ncbi:ubiquinone biosynthesis protein COQ9, mitochondrial isoform X1 [Anastrepha ludens]|uniref:ubiquinone biosynthesis protein COQ9, mitochondrial isoform X1 n=1 Tax=Anastrepha ludens TaxID=28586 RepID=UPI0023AEA1B4|nr:ubiquinone biosynthesis protein COQ9, mitochondrial isoform X1 [Anastrepha ludens]
MFFARLGFASNSYSKLEEMVNLSAFNRTVRLQRMLLPLSAHSSLLACSAHASQVLMQRCRAYSEFSQSNTYRSLLSTPTHLSYTTPTPTQFQTHFKCAYTTDSGSLETIDKFREREEQREREYEQKTADEQAQDQDAAKRAKIDAIRTQILEAALSHVPTEGWTRIAIAKGAEDVGFPSVVHGMFPDGGYALVSYFYGKCNDDVVRLLQEETQDGSLTVDDPLKFLVRAVRIRLEMIIPYKVQWSQALALIAMPQNAPTSLAQVLTLVDDICYYAGDRSVDFGWYTRRIGLATIMKMTELFMLQDSSAGHAKTWEFLKNRMDEAVQVQLMLSQTEGMTHNFTRSFNSAFITARNILGIDYTRR